MLIFDCIKSFFFFAENLNQTSEHQKYMINTLFRSEGVSPEEREDARVSWRMRSECSQSSVFFLFGSRREEEEMT